MIVALGFLVDICRHAMLIPHRNINVKINKDFYEKCKPMCSMLIFLYMYALFTTKGYLTSEFRVSDIHAQWFGMGWD